MSLLESFDIGIDFCHDLTDNNLKKAKKILFAGFA